jgi:hypothetical protein
MPLVSLTRAIFRRAEFGFLGVVVLTFRHTPRLKEPAVSIGLFLRVLKTYLKAGVLVFFSTDFRGRLLSWFIVGMPFLSTSEASSYKKEHPAPIRK